MKNATEQQATQFAGVFVQHHQLLTGAPKDDLQWAIQNPTDAVSLFVSALKSRAKKTGEEMKEVVKKVLTPFITIATGGTTKEELIADIEAIPAEATKYAKSITENKAFTISKEKGTANLVTLSVAELGFTEQPRTDEFMTEKFCAEFSAKYLDGYVIELCQSEDGLQLRKQWKNQPKGTAVWMAMERIADSFGYPRVFCVGCRVAGELWLDGSWGNPGNRWNLGNRIVFRLRKLQNSVA